MIRQLILAAVIFNVIALIYFIWKIINLKFSSSDEFRIARKIAEAHKNLEISTSKLLQTHTELLQNHSLQIEKLQKLLEEINNNADANYESIKGLIKTYENDCDIMDGLDKRIEKLEQVKPEQAKEKKKKK